jgi:hypothetical protein
MSNTTEWLGRLFKEAGTKCIELHGTCQSCKSKVDLVIWEEGLETEGNGGVIVNGEFDAKPEFKCSACLERDGGRISPTKCEIFTRVCGYLRPVQGFNPGKKAEFNDRKTYANLVDESTLLP